MKEQKKTLILGLTILILLFTAAGVTFAIFSYTNTGNNQQLVTGDIYMHYKESNTLILENALPSSTYDPTKYFEFTVDGKNTNTKYDIIYDVTLNRGDAHETRTTRLADKFLKFTLMEKKPGESEWTTVVDAKSYNDLSSGIRVWFDNIPKNQTTEIVHTYRLYMWIDNSVVVGNTNEADYNQDIWNNQVYASIKVTVTGDFEDKEVYKEPKLSTELLKHITSANSDVDSDNVTYISGCSDLITNDSDCTEANTIDFNFVWYSGKLWRIVAIYPDGAMKLITENPITSIYWGNNTNYSESWVYQWLNEDFSDTLKNKNQIIDFGKLWNATETSATAKPAETTMVGGVVGLLNAYEYKESYKKVNNTSKKGYLNIGPYWWLITPNSSTYVRVVWYGDLDISGPSDDNLTVRPAIYLSSNVTYAGGEGTRNNPYLIGEDISAPATNASLSTRVSGEYVRFNGEKYRIVGVENKTTKIVKADYIMDGSSALLKYTTQIFGTGTTDNTWDYYLNNNWLATTNTSSRSLLTEGTYYLGEYGNVGISYKATICDTTNNINYTKTTKDCNKLENTYTGYVGLLRVGEMFSSQLKPTQSSYQIMWLITPAYHQNNNIVDKDGFIFSDSSTRMSRAVRPTLNLKSNVIITSGDGTEQHPFEIALGS